MPESQAKWVRQIQDASHVLERRLGLSHLESFASSSVIYVEQRVFCYQKLCEDVST